MHATVFYETTKKSIECDAIIKLQMAIPFKRRY